jgi:hypothetical protein
MNISDSVNPGKITFQVADTGKEIMQAKHLCHDVYLNIGYIDAPYPGKIIPYEYESSSTYIIAMNPFGEVVGTIRITQGPPFKTLEIWKDNLYPASTSLISDALHGASFEIGALAVRKDFSKMKISWGLYKAAYLYSVARRLDYGIISMDTRALRALEMLGWVVVKIGAPMNYFGSLTVPGIMPVSQQPQSILENILLYHTHLAA